MSEREFLEHVAALIEAHEQGCDTDDVGRDLRALRDEVRQRRAALADAAGGVCGLLVVTPTKGGTLMHNCGKPHGHEGNCA